MALADPSSLLPVDFVLCGRLTYAGSNKIVHYSEFALKISMHEEQLYQVRQ